MEKSKGFEESTIKESEGKLGRNVEIRATFMRHASRGAEKDRTGQPLLSEKGLEESREVGAVMDALPGGIKAYSSPIERTGQTAGAALEEIAKSGVKLFKSRKRFELGFEPKSEEFMAKWMATQKQNLPKNYSELSPEEQRAAAAAAEVKTIDWWVSFGDTRPDPETFSPKEVAANVAAIADRFVRTADMADSGSKFDLLTVSHGSVLEPFLVEVLGKSLKELGGALNTAEQWDMSIKTDMQGEKTVKLHLRGKEYEVDLKKLDDLVKIYHDRGLDKEMRELREKK